MTEREPSGWSQALPLEGRRIRLVPVTPKLHRAIYDLATSHEAAFRWRFQGFMPTFDAFRETLLTDVLCQFAVVAKSERDPVVGHVFAYDANHSDGHLSMAVLSDRSLGASGVEAAALFLRYLFSQWPVRKIYLEGPEYNVLQYASAARTGLLSEERRLRNHRYYDGRYWDEVCYAVYREVAEEFARTRGGFFTDNWTPNTK
jgi:RimJ/RimL family protein N-acetyltransferase